MDDCSLSSDAIEGADVMIYAVSLAYKESSNCRTAISTILDPLFSPKHSNIP